MLGCAEIIGRNPVLSVAAEEANKLKCCETGWWAHQDSNLGPSDYESDALTN
jgi:hypothetical protein